MVIERECGDFMKKIFIRIKNYDILLFISVKFFDKFLDCVFVVLDGVEGEVFVCIYVVDVILDGVERDVCFFVVCYYVFDFVNGFVILFVLMKVERLVRYGCGLVDEVGVLINYGERCGVSEEVEI